jgi:hypothetical protein
MRSTTACAPGSSKACFSAPTTFSALASVSGAISPRTSTSAVCGLLGAVPTTRVDITPHTTASASANHKPRKMSRQRRSLRCRRR